MEAELVKSCKSGYEIKDGQVIEAITVAGDNAIKYASENKKSEYTAKVHSYYCKAACDLMNILKLNVQCENISVITALSQTNKNAALSQDQMYLLGITTKGLFIRKLIESISQEEFGKSVELQEHLINFINLYVDFSNNYKKAYLIVFKWS